MSKIQLLDLFEKPIFHLEKVHAFNGIHNITVPIDENFQWDDLCSCFEYKKHLNWVSVSTFFCEQTHSKEFVYNRLKKFIHDGDIPYSYLRRPVILHDNNNRYLREGDFLQQGDVSLKTKFTIDKGSCLIGEKYVDSEF